MVHGCCKIQMQGALQKAGVRVAEETTVTAPLEVNSIFKIEREGCF